MPLDTDIFLIYVLSLYLGLFLLPSAVGKFINYRKFIEGVIDYRVLPLQLARIFGRVLPFVELALGLFMICGIFTFFAAWINFILIVVFTLAMIINLRRNRYITCSCYGIAGNEMISWSTVARNICLIVLTVILLVVSLKLPYLPVNYFGGLYYLGFYGLMMLFLLVIALFFIVQLIVWSTAMYSYGKRLS